MQRDALPILITLPLYITLAVVPKEAKNLRPPGHTPQAGSVCSFANAHGGQAPQGAIDISVIRDIDLIQGGDYVLLEMRCGKP